jgi:cold shock CspA family protein
LLTVLTDGIRWIIFKSFTPGSNYASHEAFVFPSLEAVETDFAVFYELLSKESFGKRLFGSHFDRLHNSRSVLSQPLQAPIPEQEIKILHKTELAFDLDQVFAAFFGRLAGQQDDEMLVECFVESRESRFADLSLEKITANVLGNISPPDRDVDVELRVLIENAVDVEGGQSVFIVGPTGSGKTTFLDRFFKKTLSSTLRARCITVRINCLDSTGRQDTALHWFTEALITNFEKLLYDGGSPAWDELQGLYFTDYERRRKGVDAKLYERDKQAFKEKFGAYLDEKVEADREGYLKRILADVVHNRKMLPILLIDNTDEFSPDFKAEIFQFAQALRRSVSHCIVIFPVTDKSAWSFSKTDLYGIYKSKSFFLPTPPPREVFRRRVDFIRRKVPTAPRTGERRDYFIGRGLRLSIEKIARFATILEDVFVDDDYVSRIIGDLSNFNVRRTLELAQRVITSATLRVEDIFKAGVAGQYIPLPHAKFMNSLLRGDYQLYRQSDNHLIYPVFQVSDKIRQSPLLVIRVLALLDDTRKGARNVEDGHLSVQSIVDYFSAIGHSEIGIESALIPMLQAGLVEAYDPSVQDLLPSQRLAITSSGMRHMRLALHEEVFLEQMAVTSAILDHSVAERIRKSYKAEGRFADRMSPVKSLFVEYLMEEDGANLTIPTVGDQYETQRYITSRLRRLGSVNPVEDPTLFSMKTSADEPISGVLCTVDWFDPEKGFGFVDVEGQTEQAFLRLDKLEEAGIKRAFDGDKLLCDVTRNVKGLYVQAVYKTKNSAVEVEEADGVVIRLFRDRKYGFVQIPKKAKDAFFHFSVFTKGLPDGFGEGSTCRVEISPDKTGEGYQVRCFL